MTTQEERITALERATAEYRPVLQNITYELTIVKGLAIVPELLAVESKKAWNHSTPFSIRY